jgi:hypothetical protein
MTCEFQHPVEFTLDYQRPNPIEKMSGMNSVRQKDKHPVHQSKSAKAVSLPKIMMTRQNVLKVSITSTKVELFPKPVTVTGVGSTF